ncbi:MAG: hypothetical protein Q8R40_03870 [bacterium]|nr:hypothetical protein [bacterium]
MDKLNIKELMLGILVIVTSIISFWFWRLATIAIAEELFNSYGQFLASIGTLAIAASMFGIAAIFIKTPWVVYSSAGVGTAIPFFFIPANSIVIAAMAVCVLLSLFAVRRIRKEFSLSLGFSVANIFKAGVPLFLTLSGIIISVFYLTDVQKKDAVRTILPRSAFDITIRALGGPLKSLSGNVSFAPEDTVDQVFQGLLKKQLETRGISLNQVSQKEMQRLLAAQRDEIAASYGIKLTGKEQLGDVFYTTIIEKINDLLGPYRIYVPYASMLAFFLAFKTLSIFLYLIVLGFSYLLIKLMITANILTTKKEQIEVERISLN